MRGSVALGLVLALLACSEVVSVSRDVPDGSTDVESADITDARSDRDVHGSTRGGPRLGLSLQRLCAIRQGGSATCVGTLASGTHVVRGPAPWTLGGIDDRFDEIAQAGNNSICVRGRADGIVHCIGSNQVGLLGIGSIDNSLFSTTLVAPMLPGTSRSLDGDRMTFCALSGSGVSCWGELPLRRTSVPAPQEVVATASASSVATTAYSLCVVDDRGAAACAGQNLSGQLGHDPSRIADLSTLSPVVGLPPVSRIVMLTGVTCALDVSGDVWCWGSNRGFLLGDADPSARWTPRRISLLRDVVAMDLQGAACAVRFDGTVWCWGQRHNGLIGDGTWIPSTGESLADVMNYTLTPQRVPGIENAIDVAVGPAVACALTQDDEVWCWGSPTITYDSRNMRSVPPYRVNLD